MRDSKLEMNRGILWSPVRCICHSWIWESWTRAGGRVCRKGQGSKSENQTIHPFFFGLIEDVIYLQISGQ